MAKTRDKNNRFDSFARSLGNTGRSSGLTGGPTSGEAGHDGDAGDPDDLGDTAYTPIMGNVIQGHPRAKDTKLTKDTKDAKLTKETKDTK